MTFYSSQSGVTVEIPAGIHLHDIGLASLGAPPAEAEELWGAGKQRESREKWAEACDVWGSRRHRQPQG